MEYLLLWVAFGVACAVIALGRGRNGFAWLLIGFITGIFGLVVLLALPAIKPKDSLQSEQHSNENRKCPLCAEDIKLEAVVCKHCGREVGPAV